MVFHLICLLISYYTRSAGLLYVCAYTDYLPKILMIMKTLACRDVGFDCDAKIHADTVDEVLAQAADHASRVHGVTVTSEQAEGLKSLIREDKV